jgi:hypothetical protein
VIGSVKGLTVSQDRRYSQLALQKEPKMITENKRKVLNLNLP